MKYLSLLLFIPLMAFTLFGCGNSSRPSVSPVQSMPLPTASAMSDVSDSSEQEVVTADSPSVISSAENWVLITEYFLANFPNTLMTVAADVNHDGLADCVFVDDQSDEFARYGYVLTVKDGEVQCYLVKEGGESHSQGFFDWYLSPDEEGDAFLIEYNSAMWQGIGTLSLLSYYLDENGGKVILEEYTVGDKDEDNDAAGYMKKSVYEEFFREGARWLERTWILHHAGPWEFGNDLNILYPQVPAIPFEEEEEELQNITRPGLIDVAFTDMENPVNILGGKYQILLPLSWRDRYVIKTYGQEPTWWEERVTIYCKECYRHQEGSGELCSIEFTYMMDLHGMEEGYGDWVEIGSWEKGFVLLTKPTDVPIDASVQALRDEYADMTREAGNVIVVEVSENQTREHNVTENDG